MSGWVTVTGPPAANLLPKHLHHAAGRIEHVAEPHRHEAAADCGQDCTYSSATRLQAPITLVGIDRFVGRNHHE